MMGIVIYLKSGYVIIDEEDFDLFASCNWRVGNNGYVTHLKYTSMVKRPVCLLLHRLILNATFGEIVDHKNHNPKDNRRCNLRKASVSENMMNRRANKNSTSKYLGVSFDKSKGKWRAQIKTNGIVRNLGRFLIEKEAAIAYNIAAEKHFKEFANLNRV